MNVRDEIDQLTDRQYEVLTIVAKALGVDAMEVYYSDSYLDTMESLAEKVLQLKEIIDNHNGGE